MLSHLITISTESIRSRIKIRPFRSIETQVIHHWRTNLVSAWTHFSIISQVAANVSRDNLDIDTIARDEIFVEPTQRQRWARWVHCEEFCES
jgi:hypothetical protein